MTTNDGGTRDDGIMKASEFKVKCHKLNSKTFFGAGKGRMKIIGDIVSPMPAEWFEDPEDSRKELF